MVNKITKADETEARFARLEAENAALRAKVAALEAAAPKPKPVPPKPREEEGVRIIELPPDCGQFTKPSEAELRQLMRVVLAKYPTLAPDTRFARDIEERERDFFNQFRAAFIGLASITRTDAVDYKKFASFWIDEAEANARARGDSTTISLQPFIAAVVGHGDVAFTKFAESSDEKAFGLAIGGGGCLATDRWHEVLAGRVPEPVQGRRLRGYEPSQQVRIIGPSIW